jgi:hypothetical protein
MVRKKIPEILKVYREYLEAKKKAYATIDKNAQKKVQKIFIKMRNEVKVAQKEADKTMNPVLVKKMKKLERKFNSLRLKNR